MEGRFGYSDEIPEGIREAFCSIANTTANIKSKIDLFDELYMKEDTVKLLNDSAPYAFELIRESLAADIMMSLFRLLDPKISCGNENASIALLQNEVLSYSIIGLNDKVKRLMDLKNQVKTYRDKVLAHNDLEQIVRPATSLNPSFPWSVLQEIVNLIFDFLNLIFIHFTNGEMSFDIINLGSGDALLWCLNKT